jgi:hypothetical protein
VNDHNSPQKRHREQTLATRLLIGTEIAMRAACCACHDVAGLRMATLQTEFNRCVGSGHYWPWIWRERAIATKVDEKDQQH